VSEPTLAIRLRTFVAKPFGEKSASLLYRWLRIFPHVPVPIRLPFGAWWLARNDFVGAGLLCGGFEEAERSFIQSYLSPGMMVLDIGAHHGFYTLLASRKVSPGGRVLAIEPSPRERRKLRLHLGINACNNVEIEDSGIGDVRGSAELHLVIGSQTGSNSLRKPAVSEPTRTVSVQVDQLDNVLRRRGISNVDFIKMDVEGAELSVLKGAAHLLRNHPRPVVLAEVYDIRTEPWGYAARDIVQYLVRAAYRWFVPCPGGGLEEMDTQQREYAGNFVAVPEERVSAMAHMVKGH